MIKNSEQQDNSCSQYANDYNLFLKVYYEKFCTNIYLLKFG